MISFLNGIFISHDKAVVSIDDHGFLYGDGIYETLRVYQGKVFLLKEHLARLQHSATYVGLRLPFTLKKIGDILHETARRNGHQEAVLRLTITRGSGAYGFDPRLCAQPTIAIVSRPFVPYPRHYHEKGITLAVVSVRRNSLYSLPPHVKSTSCMNGIYAKVESLKAGAQEGVFLSLDGFLTEGTVSNVFIIKKGVLKTPQLDGTLLAGTTRGFVLRLARRLKISSQEKKLRLSDLITADEVFLSNTTMEILPVRRIIYKSDRNSSRRIIKRVNVGLVTRTLMAEFVRQKALFNS